MKKIICFILLCSIYLLFPTSLFGQDPPISEVHSLEIVKIEPVLGSTKFYLKVIQKNEIGDHIMVNMRYQYQRVKGDDAMFTEDGWINVEEITTEFDNSLEFTDEVPPSDYESTAKYRYKVRERICDDWSNINPPPALPSCCNPSNNDPVCFGITSEEAEISGGVFWPLCPGDNCSFSDYKSLMQGFNQFHTLNPNDLEKYCHNGIDIHGNYTQSDESVYSVIGGTLTYILNSTEFNADNSNYSGPPEYQVEIECKVDDGTEGIRVVMNHLELSPQLQEWYNVGYNDNGSSSPLVLLDKKITAGTLLGKIHNKKWVPSMSHVHLSIYNGISLSGSVEEDPFYFFKKYKDPTDFDYHDPYKNAPELKDWDGNGKTIRYQPDPYSSENDYFTETNHGVTFQGNSYLSLCGPLDIIAEAADHQREGTEPGAVVKSVGYFIKHQEGDNWVDVVKSEATPYILYDNALGIIEPQEETDQAIVEALLDNTSTTQADYNDFGVPNPSTLIYQNAPINRKLDNFNYRVTNTIGTTGHRDNIDWDQCWATDAQFVGVNPPAPAPPIQYDNGKIPGEIFYPEANHPLHAKFKDGLYEVNIHLTDYEHMTDNYVVEKDEVMVDNFPAFISEVNILLADNSVYEREWVTGGHCIKLDGDGSLQIDNVDDLNGTFKVIATSTEPLASLNLLLSPLVLTNTAGVSSDNLTWEFTFDTGVLSSLQNGDKILLNFSGIDFTGENILALQSMPNYSQGTGCLNIPKKTCVFPYSNDNQLWIPEKIEGLDQVHEFEIILNCPAIGGANFQEVTIDVNCICPGGYGGAEVTIIGSNGPYLVAWEGPSGYTSDEEDPSDFEISGTYKLFVQDKYGCIHDFTIPVNLCEFNENTIDVVINQDCTNSGNASIEVDASSSGAVDPFYFKWYKNDDLFFEEETTGISIANNLSKGIYSVKVFSENGCVVEFTDLEIFENVPPTITAEINPPSGGNPNNGWIGLTIEGGTGAPFDFTWTDDSGNPAGSWSNFTKKLTGLATGTYFLELGYSNGDCSKTYSFEVLSCTDLEQSIMLEGVVMAPSNINLSDGAIDLDVVDGNNYSFNYSWAFTSNPSFSATTEDIYNLSPGFYQVTVSSDICPNIMATTEFEVCEFYVKFEKPSAANCDQILSQISHSNKFGPYTYEWNNGGTNTTNWIPYNIESCVTVTNGAGCSMTRCITPTYPEIDAIYQVENASFGADNGAINVASEGGTLPHTYLWDNGVTGPTNENIPSGLHTVTITDNCGYTKELSIYVECEISPNQISTQVVPVSCLDATSGEIQISINGVGADAKFLYEINGESPITGNASMVFENLAIGEYCITITDLSNYCENNVCYTIEDASGQSNINITFDTEVSCAGSDNNTIIAYATDGVPFYNYQWSGVGGNLPLNSSGQFITNIPAGHYTVTVTDAIGCTAEEDVFLWEGQPAFDASIQVTPEILCEEEATAVAEITIITPSPDEPYFYEWKKCTSPLGPCIPLISGDSPSLFGLEAGKYIVDIKDANGCQISKVVQITNHFQINVSANVNNVCEGTSNGGSIVLTSDGIALPHTYEWSNGATTSSIYYLTPGEYTVTVTNASGCSTYETYEILESSIPELDISIGHPNCGNSDGWAKAHVINPLYNFAEYSYEWSSNNDWHSGMSTVNNVVGYVNSMPQGTYTVTVTDPFGCSAEEEIELIDNFNSTTNDFTIVPTTISGDYGEGGKIELSIWTHHSNGNSYLHNTPSDYTFSWSGWSTSGIFSSSDQNIYELSSGTYTVVVTSPNGCTQEKTFPINNCSSSDYWPNFDITNTDVTPCTAVPFGSTNIVGGEMTVTAETDNLPLNFYWSGPNGFFANTQTITNLTNSGLYTVTVTDGCVSKVRSQYFYCNSNGQLGSSFVKDDCAPGSISFNSANLNNLGGGELGNGYPFHLELFFLDGNGLTIAWGRILVKQNGWDLVAGVSEVTDLAVGNYKIISTSEYGYTDEDEFYIYGEGCIFGLTSAASSGGEAAIGRCTITSPCGGPTHNDYLQFAPNSYENPCTSGGTISCTECCGACFSFDVGNAQGIEVMVGNQCGCYFPEGTILTNELYDWAEQLGIYQTSVLGVYECESDPNPPTTSNCPEGIECPNGCYAEYLDNDFCEYYVWCLDENGEVIGDPVLISNCDGYNCGFEYLDDNGCEVEIICTDDFGDQVGDPIIEITKELCLYKNYYLSASGTPIYTGTAGSNTDLCELIMTCIADPCLVVDSYGPVDPDGNSIGSGIPNLGITLDQLNGWLNLRGLPEVEECPTTTGNCLCEAIAQLFPECPECVEDPFHNPISEFSIQATPNPFTDILTIDVSSKEESEIKMQLVDVLGNVVYEKDYSVVQGVERFQIEFASDLEIGLYYLQVSNNKGEQEVKKVIHISN